MNSEVLKALLVTFVSVMVAYVIWDLTVLEICISAFEFFFLYLFLDRIGRKFVFLELLALLAITQWLLGPMVASRLGIELSVPYDDYFKYAVPATIAYVVGITAPLWQWKKLDAKISMVYHGLSTQYQSRYKLALLLFVVGLPFWMFQNSVPVSISFIFNLLASLFMMGLMMLMFTKYKLKWLWIGFGLFVFLLTTFLNGIIGILLIWMFILFMMYTTKHPIRISPVFKIGFFLLFIWILTVLQSAKVEYRIRTWDIKRDETNTMVSRSIDQDPQLFYALIKEKLFSKSTFTDERNLAGLAIRLNQGLMVSYAMDYVPRRREYGLGDATLVSTAIAFIPRILWSDKPVVGQAEHFRKYTGIPLTKFTSATIGPIGDAYVDFGYGGIIFLGLYGLLISGFFTIWLNKSLRKPALLLWFVVIYFAAIGISEITVAVFLNAIFKFILFILGIRWVLNYIFRLNV